MRTVDRNVYDILKINKTGNVVQRNISNNHCCRGKAVSITYSECVFVALGIQHAKSMRHIVICGFSGSTKFIHIISQKAWLKIKYSP